MYLLDLTLILGTTHIFCKYFCRLNELATWYLIHCLGNFYIVLLCYEPILNIINDPLYELFNPTQYYTSMLSIIFLHVYHMIFFKCNYDDIFHHLVFVGIGSFTIFFFENGYYSALSHFFICGLPGGIDYFFLFLYKSGNITKETRLKVSVFLNTWIRSPGLCVASTFSLINFTYSQKTYWNIFETLLQIFMTMGNGQMYMRDIVYAAGQKNIY